MTLELEHIPQKRVVVRAATRKLGFFYFRVGLAELYRRPSCRFLSAVSLNVVAAAAAIFLAMFECISSWTEPGCRETSETICGGEKKLPGEKEQGGSPFDL